MFKGIRIILATTGVLCGLSMGSAVAQDKMSDKDMSGMKMSNQDMMDKMGKMSTDDKAMMMDKMPMEKKMTMMKNDSKMNKMDK